MLLKKQKRKWWTSALSICSSYKCREWKETAIKTTAQNINPYHSGEQRKHITSTLETITVLERHKARWSQTEKGKLRPHTGRGTAVRLEKPWRGQSPGLRWAEWGRNSQALSKPLAVGTTKSKQKSLFRKTFLCRGRGWPVLQRTESRHPVPTYWLLAHAALCTSHLPPLSWATQQMQP